MDKNEFVSNFVGYQKTAKQIIAATSSEIHLTEEQTQRLLDAIDHSKSSYAEESAAEDLKQLRNQYEESQKDQAKENRVNRWLTVASLLVAVVSMVAAILSLFS